MPRVIVQQSNLSRNAPTPGNLSKKLGTEEYGAFVNNSNIRSYDQLRIENNSGIKGVVHAIENGVSTVYHDVTGALGRGMDTIDNAVNSTENALTTPFRTLDNLQGPLLIAGIVVGLYLLKR